MKTTLRLTPLIALLTLVGACTKPADSALSTPTGAGAADTEVTLTDQADSLGYFLGISMAEKIRSTLEHIPSPQSDNLDPEVTGFGIKSLLTLDSQNIGFQYGAIHGASIQQQLALIRQADTHISNTRFMAGFTQGMNCDSAQNAPIEILDRLMTPVNNRLIRLKSRTR